MNGLRRTGRAGDRVAAREERAGGDRAAGGAAAGGGRAVAAGRGRAAAGALRRVDVGVKGRGAAVGSRREDAAA